MAADRSNLKGIGDVVRVAGPGTNIPLRNPLLAGSAGCYYPTPTSGQGLVCGRDSAAGNGGAVAQVWTSRLIATAVVALLTTSPAIGQSASPTRSTTSSAARTKTASKTTKTTRTSLARAAAVARARKAATERDQREAALPHFKLDALGNTVPDI